MKNIKKIQMAVLMLLVAILLVACSDSATPTTGSTTSATTTNATTSSAATTSDTATTTEAGAMSGSTVSGTAAAGTPEPTFMPAMTNQTPIAAPGTTSAATPVAVKDSKLKTSLNIWSALNGNQSQLLNDQVKQFMQAYPGVKVTVTKYNPDEIEAEFQSASNAGNAPDLVLTTSDYVSDFTALKLVQPVDNLMDTQAYAPNAIAPSSQGGKQYGVPYVYGNTLVLMYNKKLIPNAPTDTDQLIQMAKAAMKPGTNKKDKVQGLIMDMNEPYDFAPWVYGFGGSLLDSNNQPSLNSAGVTQALQFFDQLAYKDKIASANYEPARNQADYYFRDGTLAFYITTDQNAMNYASTSGAAAPPTAKDPNGVGLELGIAPLPKVTATGKNPTPFTNSDAIFVGAKTSGDKLTAAKDFFSYVASPDQQSYMAAHYKLLPPTTAGLGSDAVKSNAALSGIAAQLVLALPEPSQPQMKAVWDAIRPNLEAAVAQVAKPQDAAQAMQQAALTEIKSLGIIQP